MNLTKEQFVSGLEQSVNSIPGVLEEWAFFDDEIRDEYVEQFNWMLNKTSEILKENSWEVDFIDRINAALFVLIPLKNKLATVLIVSPCNLCILD